MDLRLIEQMLRDLNRQPPVVKPTGPGSLVNFTYMYAKMGHPQSPLVLVTDFYPKPPKPPVFMRGVNIQYLTPAYIMRLLDKRYMNGCNNPRFSYFSIKGDAFVRKAFRKYRLSGIMNLKQFDCAFLSSLINAMRGIDINEIYQFQQQVREQIARATNPVAQATIQDSPPGV